jgi:hypothetical protein
MQEIQQDCFYEYLFYNPTRTTNTKEKKTSILGDTSRIKRNNSFFFLD